MKIYTFKGGVHPKEMKELSNDKPVTRVFPKSNTVTIPVTMGGAANTPVVKVGDTVAKGQVIATGDKFMNCPVHASVSGKVKKIQKCLVTGNQEVPCIIIESDGLDTSAFMEIMDPFKVDAKTAVNRIKEAGIVGMGGASFPTHVKLSIPEGKKCDWVLVNAAECEPYLTSDERTLREETEKVVDGLSIVCHIVGAQGKIVLEDNKKSILPLLEAEINKQNLSHKLSVCLVKTKYPQGSEKFIVKASVNREIPTKKLPIDAGCVICNTSTVVAISDAFRLGLPLIERTLTISGLGVDEPKNIKVPVGTLISDLEGTVFNMKDDTVKVISGGPMMGFSMSSLNFPVAKGTSGVTFLTKAETSTEQGSQCIGCGRCVATCAMNLNPVLMIRSLKGQDYLKAVRFGLMDCIECGCCAFVCPANVPLIQHIRLGKGIVRSLKK